MSEKSYERSIESPLDQPSLDKSMYKIISESIDQPAGKQLHVFNCGLFNGGINYIEGNECLSKDQNNTCSKTERNIKRDNNIKDSIKSTSIKSVAIKRNSIKKSTYILLCLIGSGISFSMLAPSSRPTSPGSSFAQNANSIQNNQEYSGTYQNSNFGSFNNSMVFSPLFVMRNKDDILSDLYKNADTSPKPEGGICGFFQTVLTAVPTQLMPSNMYQLGMPDNDDSIMNSRIRNTETRYDFLDRLHDKELLDTFLLSGVVEGLGKLIKDGKSLTSDPILTSILGGNIFGIRNFTESMIRSMREDPGIIGQLKDRLSLTDNLPGDSLVKKLALDINEYQNRVKRMRQILNIWRSLKDLMNNGMTRPALDNFMALRDMLNQVPDNIFVGFDVLKGYAEYTCDSYSISKDMSDHRLQELCAKYKFPTPAGGVTEWMQTGDQTGLNPNNLNPHKLNRAIWAAWQPKADKLKDYMELLKNYLPEHYNIYIDLDESPQVAGYTFTAEQNSANKRIEALDNNKECYKGSLYESSNNPDAQNLFARGAFFNHDFSSSLFDEYIATQFNRIICGQVGEVQRHCMTAYLALLCKMFKIEIPEASTNDEINNTLTGLGKTINEVLSGLYNTPESIVDLRNQATKSKLKNVWYCGCLMLCPEYKELLKKMELAKFKRHISENGAPYNSLLRRKWFKQLVEWNRSDKDSVRNLSGYLLSVVYRDVINAGLDILIKANGGANKDEVLERINNYFRISSPDEFRRVIYVDSKILDSEIKNNIMHNLWDLCVKLKTIGESLYEDKDILLSDLISGNFDKDPPQLFPDALKAIAEDDRDEIINIIDDINAGTRAPSSMIEQSPMGSITTHPMDYIRKRGSSVKINTNTNNDDDDDVLGKSVRDLNRSINELSGSFSGSSRIRQRRNTMIGNSSSPGSPGLSPGLNSPAYKTPASKNIRPNTPFVNSSLANASFNNSGFNNAFNNNHSIHSDHSDISGGLDSAAISSGISSGGFNTPQSNIQQSNTTAGNYISGNTLPAMHITPPLRAKVRDSLPSPIQLSSIQQQSVQQSSDQLSGISNNSYYIHDARHNDSAQSNLVSSSDESSSVRNSLLSDIGIGNNLQVTVMLIDENNISSTYPVFLYHNREMIPCTSNMQNILSGETLYVLANKGYHLYSLSRFGQLGVNVDGGAWKTLFISPASSISRDRSRSPAALAEHRSFSAFRTDANDSLLGSVDGSGKYSSGNYDSGNYDSGNYGVGQHSGGNYSNVSNDSSKNISRNNSANGNSIRNCGAGHYSSENYRSGSGISGNNNSVNSRKKNKVESHVKNVDTRNNNHRDSSSNNCFESNDPAIGSNSPLHFGGFKAFEGSIRRDSKNPNDIADQNQSVMNRLGHRRFSLDNQQALEMRQEEIDDEENRSNLVRVANLMRRASDNTAKENLRKRNSGTVGLSAGDVLGASVNPDNANEEEYSRLKRTYSNTTQIGKQ